MPPIRHRLEHCLILLDDYLHPLFGADKAVSQPFLNLRNKLGEYPDGYDNNGRSFLAQRLSHLYQRDVSELEGYDDNIKKHLDSINASRPQDDQITLKYFQLLALLYTEHVLHRLFNDVGGFVSDLNLLIKKRNERERKDKFDEFTVNDLTKLAYWMATGSGKTLLLHINYYQITHYLTQAKLPPYENILLITPNAGLSQQHLNELQLSGIPACLFQQSATVLPGTVQIIEITKFTAGTSGPQTINVDSFEGRNLVFVDEGHRGSSGDVWFGYRDKLSSAGFTFEYSATFGEALNSGNKPSDIAIRHSYGKAVVFDYSYRYFYGDGYGKDYTILNLPKSYNENDRDTLLLANLLTLFEQTWLYLEYNQQMRDYLIERPLLMFVGHTVQAGKKQSDLTQADKESLSDVLDIIRFLHRVTHDKQWAIRTLKNIINEQSGLTNEGVDVFHSKFPILKNNFSPETLYENLLKNIFHASAPGPIHLSNLRNAIGEVSLRVGTSDTPFGVINIGDEANFLNMVENKDLGLVVDTDDAFRNSLFETINYTTSTINVLVGAKKFTEGWSSWRVSGMGLLNVGRSEGSEVIQMFGRGVRLKGYQRSLKRSTAVEGNHPAYLPLMETLNIFSINGDYLSEFRKALEREGITEGFEEMYLPVRFDTFEKERPQLYVIRMRQDKQFVNQPSFPLCVEDNSRIKPEIDFTSGVQVASSQQAAVIPHAGQSETYIRPELLDFLDWDTIYIEMLAWRRQRNFSNMVIERATLKDIMATEVVQGQVHPIYYRLFAPEGLITPSAFNELPRLQSIVLAIMKQYAERYYNFKRQQWESENLEYRLLDKNDPNMVPAMLPLSPPRPGYVVKISRNKPELIDAVETLIQQGDDLYKKDQTEFPNIIFDRHLYTPILAKGYYDGDTQIFTSELDIKSVPVGLNEGEARLIWELRNYLQRDGAKKLGEKKLYLLRNLSRGRGVGFFEASNFYPDFILWVVDGDKQRIIFLDPKGLAMLRPNDFSHPKIQLFKTLKEDITPSLNNPKVSLDSFIISAESHGKTSRYFGNPNKPYSLEEFYKHHVLFPGTTATVLEKVVSTNPS